MGYILDLAGLRLVFEDSDELPASASIVFGSGLSATYDATTGKITVGAAAGAGVAALSTALFVDAGTAVASVDQDGSIGAPFDDIQSAATALDEVMVHAIVPAPGAYMDALTINSSSDFVSIRPLGKIGMGDVTVTAGTLDLHDATVTGLLTVASGQQAGLTDCTLVAGIDGSGAIQLLRCIAGGSDPITCGSLFAKDTSIETEEVNLSNHLITSTLERMTFLGATVFTFTGTAGTLQLADLQTLRAWVAAGCTLANGTLLYPGKVRTISGTTHTVEAADIGCVLLCTHASGCTITIPQAADLPVLPGAQAVVHAIQGHATGQVTWDDGGSMVLSSPATKKSRQQHSTTTAMWLTDNDTRLSGDLEL